MAGIGSNEKHPVTDVIATFLPNIRSSAYVPIANLICAGIVQNIMFAPLSRVVTVLVWICASLETPR